jgi:hypothetical protein
MWQALRTYWRVLTAPWGDIDSLRARHEAALQDYERDVRFAGDLMASAAESYAATERLLREEALSAVDERLALVESHQEEVDELQAFVRKLDRERGDA